METLDGIHTVYEGDVQYPYADVGAPELLHISRVTQENRKDFNYICPCCNKPLHPRLGEKNRHCFYHDSGSRCSMDKYIHDTAKRLLWEKWEHSESFEITLNVNTICNHHDTCTLKQANAYYLCQSAETRTIDLKKYYHRCIIEKKIDKFIPDLRLIDDTGKRDTIFIEIWSKHKNSEIKANSNYKIIEIRIKSVDELEGLSKRPIIESDDITFSHFDTVKKIPENFSGERFYRYFLYPKLTSYCTEPGKVRCTNFQTLHQSSAILEITGRATDFSSRTDFWTYCNTIAREKGFDVRACNLCRLYWTWDAVGGIAPSKKACGRNGEEYGPIDCKLTDAMTCNHFIYKDFLAKKIKDQYSHIQIWQQQPNSR